MKKVIIAAGGTGGHIFPGIVIARQLFKEDVQVLWIGGNRGIEKVTVAKYHIPLELIKVSGLKGKRFFSVIKGLFQMITATFQAARLINKHKTDVILVMGGYVSGPVGLAAWLLKKPLIVHEQNTIPGFTNKILARFFAQVVCQSFPQTFLKGKKIITSGNPVRSSILALGANKKCMALDNSLKVLILGGSLGSRALNTVLPKSAAMFLPQKQGESETKSEAAFIEFWHQTGPVDYDSVSEAYQQSGVSPYKLEPFIDDIAAAYQWADVVVCRAGATTVAELIAARIPAIFVPYPYAVNDHQTKNAQYIADKKASIIIQQEGLTAEKLYQALSDLIVNRQQLIDMRNNMDHLVSYDKAAEVISGICRSLSV